MNFFELFNLTPAFDLDAGHLTARYRELQRQHHPDQILQSQHSDASAVLSDALNSALVNDAYDTLRIAAKRAAYLLDLKGQAIALEQSIGDVDFLSNAMEVREQLDEADSTDALESLRVEINQWISALSNEFKIDYAAEDWPEARDTSRKLAFMQRILNDIDSAEDRFDDLDDLY
ncbi:Fe-S protein assembly co-chaperone HscB [Aquirhabdus sp.]|uniref:Fe-S protein assembly co-chaperone HscB n=1 Tax=Aquirhabdus sp. TaxID=2824160 RepID=UPI00396C6C34